MEYTTTQLHQKLEQLTKRQMEVTQQKKTSNKCYNDELKEIKEEVVTVMEDIEGLKSC